MARADAGRAGEMEVFARVVEEGGFSAAARALRLTPSAVSKLVARVEARHGVRLLARSTHAMTLTPEGEAYYRGCRRVLAEIEAAEAALDGGARPRGVLRVNASVPFGSRFVVPLLPAFLGRYPGLRVDVTLSDAVADLLAGRVDVAVRAGPLPDSALAARKLLDSPRLVVASPTYLARRGAPASPGDLARHDCLGFNFRRAEEGWPFAQAGRTRRVAVSGSAAAGDGETLRALALAGVGLARLAAFHVAGDVAAGRLVPVLQPFNPGDREPVHAVFLQGDPLPARVRAFVDFLVAELG
jgi:DNA-binding transcriptional LysR family regulator